MKSIIFVLIVFSTTLPLHSQLDGDKALHFGAGAISGYLGATMADELSDGNPYWRITGAFAGSLLVGMAKEVYDEQRYGGWDSGDLAATVIGGVTVGITINLFSGKKNIKKTTVLTSLSAGNGFGFDRKTLGNVPY